MPTISMACRPMLETGRMRNDVQLATHEPLFNEQVEATPCHL